ncbi:MAG: LytR/AlgR family response regulator transcription factor [Vicinamibacterales bacterium]
MTARGSLRVLVADDEPLARRRLTALLRHRPEVGQVIEVEDGDAALSTLRRDDVDMAFLDVQLPGRDGVTVARCLAPGHPAVVFVTAFDRHAVAAFDLAAVDYLLKPFDDDRFAVAFERARRWLATSEAPGDGAGARSGRGAASGRAHDAKGHITVERGGRALVIPVGDIDWVSAAGNYVEVHAGGSTYLVRATLRLVSDRLPTPPFLRIHRRVLANADRIAFIELASAEPGVVLRDGTRLPLSRRCRRRLPTLAR